MRLPPDRLPEIRALFDAALDLPPGERDGFLDRETAGDSALRAEVAGLLGGSERSPVDFGRPLAQQLDLAPAGPSFDLIGRRLGAYQVVRAVGEGGMGTVYEAERADAQFTKRVAIKTLRHAGGLAGHDMLARFRRERQIQATLTHPNIAALLDAGMTEGGTPYIVLEYVDGLPIDEYCDTNRLGIPARLDLFRQVLGAVQHAHRQLVVHRDLKPSNILVSTDGVVKLLDFGISKLLGDPGEDHTATGGLRAFTMAYASPEQLRGEPISTATDLYSLGVVLYRLLAGRHPFDLDQSTPAAAWTTICEVTPPFPSRMATDSGARAAGLADADRLARALRGELDAIVLMALRKEPDRRYPTVDALSDDLQNHLRGMPVMARPDTAGYRFRKLVRRNRLASAAVAAGLMAVLAGGGVAIWQARTARALAAVAEEERRTAQGVSAFLQGIFASADPSFAGRGLGVDATIGEAIDLAAGRIDTDLADQPAVAEELHRQMVSIYAARRRQAEGKLHARRVLELQRQRGAPGPVVARSLHDLSELYRLEGGIDSATALLQEAYRLFQAAGEPETEDFAVILNGLALVAWARGDHAAAESTVTRALGIAERAGSADRLLAIGHSNLGVMREVMGDLDGAEAAFRTAEALHARGTLGDSYERGSNLNNLAGTLATQGQLREAESVMSNALAIWARTVGSTHPALGLGRFTLARIQVALGRPVEALATIDTAYQYLGTFATDHPDRSRGTVQQAAAYLALGRLEEAEHHASSAVAIRRGAFPPKDVRTAEAELVLGKVLVARGKLEEGRLALGLSAESYRLAYGPNHPRTVAADQALRAIPTR